MPSVKKGFCLLLLVSLFFCSNANADLKTLIEVGSSQKNIADALNKETASYNKVKEAITSGQLKEGMKAEIIEQKYGKPVIDSYDKKKDAFKWLYMPAESNHFKGEKLYLFISKDNTLLGWELVEQ